MEDENRDSPFGSGEVLEQPVPFLGELGEKSHRRTTVFSRMLFGEVKAVSGQESLEKSGLSISWKK